MKTPLAWTHDRADFASAYDRYRPAAPDSLVDLLIEYRGVGRPRLVVDLGCGTGLSTHVWADRASRVVGVDTSEAMVAAARRAPNVDYVVAAAEETGLERSCADIVTASQSFHWMNADRTLAEVKRLLVPGGVFAVYFHEWPPLVQPDVDAAFQALRDELGMHAHANTKRLVPAQLRDSGRFRYTRSIVLHHREEGDADRLVGLATALGPVSDGLASGDERTSAEVDRLRVAATAALGERRTSFWWGYHVWIGVT